MPSPATMQRKAIGLIAVVAIALRGLRRMRLSAGDEGRQPIDVAVRGRDILLMRAVRLLLGLLMLRKRLRIARDIGLRLARAVRRLAAAHGGLTHGGLIHGRLTHGGLPIVAFVIEGIVPGAAWDLVVGAREVRIVLAELLLRRRDHAIIVLGVLIVIFGGNSILTSHRFLRKCEVTLVYLGGASSDALARAMTVEGLIVLWPSRLRLRWPVCVKATPRPLIGS